MKIFMRCVVITLALGMVYNSSYGQSFKDMINNAAKKKGINIPGNKGSGLSNTEVIDGLKQALQVGTQNSAKKLSAINGYLGNPLVKIIMPPEARKVEDALRRVGLGSKVDQAITSMNRAAEDAANKAVPIFVNAITTMTIQDGLSILRGDKNAATNYLRSRTYAALTVLFKPEIQKSLDKVDATRYWSDVFSNYNRIPMVEKVNPDLTAYVTEKALDGLFITIAQEEANIRANPAARVTDLLKKVFGTP